MQNFYLKSLVFFISIPLLSWGKICRLSKHKGSNKMKKTKYKDRLLPHYLFYLDTTSVALPSVEM